MSEVKRYRWEPGGMRQEHGPIFGIRTEWVMATALEAQAAKNVRAVKDEANCWRAKLEAQAEEHERKLIARLDTADGAWRDALDQEKTKHAAEIAAQAEGHEEALERNDDLRIRVCEAMRRQHGKEITAQAEEYSTEFDRTLREIERLTAELAALRGEGEAALIKEAVLKIHRLITVSHKSVGARICVRCNELWPCETAVIAGISDA